MKEKTKTVIEVRNVSKMYDLGLVGTGTLSRDLSRAWAKMRGKPDPFEKLVELNDRTKKTQSGSVWALKDINFEVKQGEVLGIVGRNGAGKSTLLKILSQITSPTTGSLKLKGRIASLLEVGTGMHPEMTAKQNIYLNGSIMGMSRKEVTSKLDEIVEFAGIGKYIDTPIKRFSSGMQVRLGFAVAAFLEPEILIVDEVLAVGDAEFQKKAIGKMQDISEGGGRTVLFVSHNMAAVKSLCTRAILIENGMVVSEGNTKKIVSEYINGGQEFSNRREFNEKYSFKEFSLHSITLNNTAENFELPIVETEEIQLITELDVHGNGEDNYYHITYRLYTDSGVALLSSSNFNKQLNLKEGKNRIICYFPKNLFKPGQYFLTFNFDKNHKVVFGEKNIISFLVQNGSKEIGTYMGAIDTYLKPDLKWEVC
jgi:lipopolysaccharide transport system ATP-binding protein